MPRPNAFLEHDRGWADPAPRVTPVRVVAIPAGHPYVATVTASPDVTLLPDPAHPGAPAGQWWPPVALDPSWIREHSGDADLLHIHFGTESFSRDHLVESLSAAHEAGWPVVFTVHDIEHPQLSDQADYRAQLDVLIPGADALVTLTPGAAAAIRERWGREAVVSPHPALFPTDAMYPRGLASSEILVGMHLKDLRSNVDGVGMVRALGAALDLLAAAGTRAHGEVRMHHHVRDTAARDTIREIVRRSDRMVLIEHDRLDDVELWNSLARLDACVLPYNHGTHSGWLELCWDLAVPVAVPAVGFYGDQHTDDTVAAFTATPDGDALATALTAVLGSPAATRAGSPEREGEFTRRRSARLAQATTTAALHASLYQRLRDEAQS